MKTVIFNSECQLSFKNIYSFELIDAKTNKIKEVRKTHNLILDNFYQQDMLSGWPGMFGQRLRLGSGTTPPKSTDKGLEIPLWNKEIFEFYSWDWKKKQVGRTRNTEFLFFIPEGDSYVGTISEVSLLTRDSSLDMTRAVFPPIKKTSSDILKIKVEVTITYPENFFFDTRNDFMSGNTFNCIDMIAFCRDSHGMETGYTSDPYQKSLDKRAWYYGRNDGECANYGDPRKKIFPFKEFSPQKKGIEFEFYLNPLPQNSAIENQYANSLRLSGLGVLRFPLAIFPPREKTGLNIGIGDGLTKEFKCPLNFFTKNTDKVYKNGVLLTRGVDYTIDNENNQDMLWEFDIKHMAIEELETSTKPTMGKPLLTFELDTPKKANFYKIPEDNTLLLEGLPLMIEISNDGFTFTKVFETTEVMGDISFPTTKPAKFWRLQTDRTSWWEVYHDYPPYLGYRGRGIIFKKAPEKGSVLTFSAEIDRFCRFKDEAVKGSLLVKFISE